jgi:hypothetical protein
MFWNQARADDVICNVVCATLAYTQDQRFYHSLQSIRFPEVMHKQGEHLAMSEKPVQKLVR